MPNGQVTYNLSFTADTEKAKKQIFDLQKSLDKLINNTTKKNDSFIYTDEIQKATLAAAQLQTQLTNATNVNTGRLDLTKFTASLKSSGMDLQKYQFFLSALGPEGDKVFSQLARSITMAEVPLKRTSKLMSNFMVTMKNTVKWQLSSSIMHGFMSTLQGAWSYTKNLNASLNDIRIVTGQNVEQMARFAEYANKSAQALSTSTTAYSKAALIYFQQGLGDAEVKARTDVTMKMSNVTKDSAQDVSSYMTAIWNNFAEGSDNLEHFADVITALGAATASSSAEIAGGLEKFAAIGKTVGLSYDYATTALATIVAQTRQSEDTVGTGLRTIFSRLESLQLGDTLEDGTDLTKYTKALATVGVSIKDQNGNLKDMDNILDDIGSKWQSLSRDQQMALAQTVGGWIFLGFRL